MLPVLPRADPAAALKPTAFHGLSGRYPFPHSNDDFEQVRRLFRDVLSEQERTALVDNICYSLSACRKEVQANMLRVFYQVDQDYGARVEKSLAGYAAGGSVLEKIAQKVGLASDKLPPEVGTTKEMDLSV